MEQVTEILKKQCSNLIDGTEYTVEVKRNSPVVNTERQRSMTDYKLYDKFILDILSVDQIKYAREKLFSYFEKVANDVCNMDGSGKDIVFGLIWDKLSPKSKNSFFNEVAVVDPEVNLTTLTDKINAPVAIKVDLPALYCAECGRTLKRGQSTSLALIIPCECKL